MKYYFAYGSNLNMEQMAWRCSLARPVGTALLESWRLVFKGSKTGSYLTIEPDPNGQVPIGVWAISKSDEKTLDRYEGFPRFYDKKLIELSVRSLKGKRLGMKKGLIYIMNPNRDYELPDIRYVLTCLEGYEDFGFDSETISLAISETRRETK